MATFTTFCFGTGESQAMSSKNIISQFSEACVGDFSIIDGPKLLGREVSANAAAGLKQIIHWLQQQKTLENNINLTGFSRGSITCIRIANALKKQENMLRGRLNELNAEEFDLLRKLEKIKINIFANDPVAGLLDKSIQESRVIPDNVSNYIAILQCDEMRRDFKPQDLTRTIIASSKTQVSMLPMYGNHSDNTKLKSDKIDSGSRIIWYSLYHFLTQHGTQFKANLIPQLSQKQGAFIDLQPIRESAELLSLFSKHHEQRRAYLRSGQQVKLTDGVPLFRTERSLNDHLQFYVKDSEFFVNQLERELFKITYPQVFNYLFEHNLSDPRFPRADFDEQHLQAIRQELNILKAVHPELFIRLNSRGVSLDKTQKIQFGSPQGFYCLESCDSVQQLFPNLVPAAVKEHNALFQPLSNLEKEVYRLSFRYLREKSELSIFSDRGQSTHAIALRKNVQALILDPFPNHSQLSATQLAQAKQEAILDLLEKNYIYLEKANNSSALRGMLKDLLNQYGRNYKVQEQTSMLRILMADLVYLSLTLIKFTLNFGLNLGYIGGGLLTAVGILFEDMGERLANVVGDFGSNIALNIAKAPVLVLAHLIKEIGHALHLCFGLRPLAEVIDQGMQKLRDSIVIAIEGKEVTRELKASSSDEDIDDPQSCFTMRS